jgi:hypothetical protein
MKNARADSGTIACSRVVMVVMVVTGGSLLTAGIAAWGNPSRKNPRHPKESPGALRDTSAG